MAVIRQRMGGLAREAALKAAQMQDTALKSGLVVNGYSLLDNDHTPRMPLGVLLYRDDDIWTMAQLSYSPRYRSGEEKQLLIDWKQACLPNQTYLHTCRPANIIECDINKTFGVISARDAQRIIRKCDLSERIARVLKNSINSISY